VFRNRAVSLALVGLFLWLTACTSYKQIERAQVPDHGSVRVTLADGERETLDRPWLTADSIKGYRHIETLSIPLDQVELVEASSISAGRTILLATGVLLVALVAASAIDCSNNPDKWGC
jgi:hypothetical protein